MPPLSTVFRTLDPKVPNLGAKMSELSGQRSPQNDGTSMYSNMLSAGKNDGTSDLTSEKHNKKKSEKSSQNLVLHLRTVNHSSPLKSHCYLPLALLLHSWRASLFSAVDSQLRSPLLDYLIPTQTCDKSGSQ